MNGVITEKAFEKMNTSEKLWLLYNTMYAREKTYKKNFKRIYILIGAIIISILINNGSDSLAAALKFMGLL